MCANLFCVRLETLRSIPCATLCGAISYEIPRQPRAYGRCEKKRSSGHSSVFEIAGQKRPLHRKYAVLEAKREHRPIVPHERLSMREQNREHLKEPQGFPPRAAMPLLAQRVQ